jgi:hypothetical protein
MSMKKILALIITVTLAAWLWSCATTSLNAKYLVGTWQPVSAEKYVPLQKKQKPVKEKAKPADSTHIAKAGTVTPTISQADQRMADELNRLVETEKRTPLVIKDNFTAVKQYRNRTLTGTWKLKKQGTRIQLKEQTTGQTLRADILDITDSTMIIVEHAPQGMILVNYHKK